MNRYEDERARRFYQQALDRVRALPGIESATAGTRFPLELNLNLAEIWVDGHELTPDEDSPLDVDVTMRPAGTHTRRPALLLTRRWGRSSHDAART